MKPEAKRIAIAEACGWKVHWEIGDPFKYFCKPGDHSGVCCGIHLSKEEIFREFFTLGDCGPLYVVPSYLADLNAMAEAEKTLKEDDHREFDEILMDMCGVKGIHGAIHATAAQRAEAFLRTLSKWEEAP